MTLKPLLWPTVFTVPVLVILLCLGTWQLKRLEYKTSLLAQIDQRIDLAARTLPEPEKWPNLKKDQWNFTPVFLEGEFDHEQEFHVFTHISDDKGRFEQAGYFVLTPLKLSGDEKYILISRGFVPQKLKNKTLRPQGQINGKVKLEGVLRFSERPNVFTPEPDMERNIWFVRDVSKMAGVLKGKPLAPFFIELKNSQPQYEIPQPRALRPNIRNNHLSYAITWYGIALGLIGVYIAYHLRHGRTKNSKKK